MSVETYPCGLCAYHRQERPSWEPGPWADEPDRFEWRHAGLACVLHRGGAGSWCGYVGLPPGHPFHGRDYSEVEDAIEVHGGLTYSEGCRGHVCHTPLSGEPDALWWLGWDAAHAWDLSPGFVSRRKKHETYPRLVPPGREEHYWTLAEARAETERLAAQLAGLSAGCPALPGG